MYVVIFTPTLSWPVCQKVDAKRSRKLSRKRRWFFILFIFLEDISMI